MLDIDAYLGYDYPVEIRTIDGQFYLTLHDLNLVARNADLSAAFADIDRQKRTLLEHHHSLGTLSTLPVPAAIKTKRELQPFFIKAAVVALVGAFLFSTASVSFSYALREPLRKMTQRTAKAVMRDVTNELIEFANDPQSQEREERLRLAIRMAVVKLKPYAEELRPLFDGPTGTH